MYINARSKVVINLKYWILVSSLLTFGDSFPQRLYLEVSPNCGLAFGTYTIDNSEHNQIRLHKGLSDRIAFSHGAFGIDVTMFNWRNLYWGLSCSKGGAVTRLKYSYNSTIELENTVSQTTESQGNSTNILQLGTYIKYSINTSERVKHFFSIYLFALFDRTNFLPLYDTYTILGDGSITSDYQSYPEKFEDKKGASLMFKYEISFNTKKSRNIFNLFLAYQQGIIQMDEITLNVQHSSGYSMSAISKSRGSYFTFGLAKPILIWPWRPNKKVKSGL